MTAGKWGDRKQPVWDVPRKRCFEKSAKFLKLVKEFRVLEKKA